MTEKPKAERKTLIANNREMESATKVRREFVKTLLSRKTAPKGWQYFTVHAIFVVWYRPSSARLALDVNLSGLIPSALLLPYCCAMSRAISASSSLIISPDTSTVTVWIVPVNVNGG
jgi:hypothetical protein